MEEGAEVRDKALKGKSEGERERKGPRERSASEGKRQGKGGEAKAREGRGKEGKPRRERGEGGGARCQLTQPPNPAPGLPAWPLIARAGSCGQVKRAGPENDASRTDRGPGHAGRGAKGNSGAGGQRGTRRAGQGPVGGTGGSGMHYPSLGRRFGF